MERPRVTARSLPSWSQSVACGGAIAAVSLPQIDPGVLARIVYARAYFRPNVRMLEIADQLLGVKPTLIEILRLTSRPDRLDSWAPVRIPLA